MLGESWSVERAVHVAAGPVRGDGGRFSRLAGQEADEAVEQELRKRLSPRRSSAAPIESFPTDGRLYVFSAIDPVESQKGALKLTTVHEDLFHGLLFGVVVLGGIALSPPGPECERWSPGCSVIVLVLCGGLLADLGPAGLGGMLVGAVVVVLIVWGLRFVVRRPIRRKAGLPCRSPTSPPPAAGVPPVPPSPMSPRQTSRREGAAMSEFRQGGIVVTVQP